MIHLVTGATGLIGSHLVEHLRAAGAAVVALSRRGPTRCDLLDAEGTARTIAEARPDVIFHLAAQSLPGESWRDPQQTFRVNVEGTLNLLEAVRRAGLSPRLVIACSSSEYAASRDGRPIAEDHPLEPLSPYAVSKLAVDHLAQLYGKRYGMRIVRARPFFLIGPSKTGDVCSDWARRIVGIERGRETVLRVGTLDTVREFLDVRDGVRAFELLAERGRDGEVYNICTGQGRSLRELLEIFRSLARVPIREEVDPALLRPLEEKIKVGDPTKLKSLGWEPRIPLEDSLRRILDYWRAEEG